MGEGWACYAHKTGTVHYPKVEDDVQNKHVVIRNRWQSEQTTFLRATYNFSDIYNCPKMDQLTELQISNKLNFFIAVCFTRQDLHGK